MEWLWRGVGLLIMTVAMAKTVVGGPDLPPNPHQGMNEEGSCSGCHSYYRDEIEPHEFIIDISENCMECHSSEKLGRSHPVGVRPADSRLEIEIPEELPLVNEEVTCGTCHQPHGDWLSRNMAGPRQEPEIWVMEEEEEIPYYKTYYLRFSDPEEGFSSLCQMCHDY